MNMWWSTQAITIEMIILTFPVYTQVLFTVALIYISFLSHCQEMRRKGRGSQNSFFITSTISFISSNQLGGFSISGNNLLSRWNGGCRMSLFLWVRTPRDGHHYFSFRSSEVCHDKSLAISNIDAVLREYRHTK